MLLLLFLMSCYPVHHLPFRPSLSLSTEFPPPCRQPLPLKSPPLFILPPPPVDPSLLRDSRPIDLSLLQTTPHLRVHPFSLEIPFLRLKSFCPHSSSSCYQSASLLSLFPLLHTLHTLDPTPQLNLNPPPPNAPILIELWL